MPNLEHDLDIDDLRLDLDAVTAEVSAGAASARTTASQRRRWPALAAAAVVLLTGGLIWLLASDENTPVGTADAPEVSQPTVTGPDECPPIGPDARRVGVHTVAVLPTGFVADELTQVVESFGEAEAAGTQTTQRFTDGEGRWIEVSVLGGEDPAAMVEQAHAGVATQDVTVPGCEDTINGTTTMDQRVSVSSTAERTIAGTQTWEYGAFLVTGGPGVSRSEVLTVVGGLR